MSERAHKTVRRILGTRLRALRKERRLSQERLGKKAGLSGKFIGEVERGEKSISMDSLAGLAEALAVPLRELTDVPTKGKVTVTPEAEQLLAFVRTHQAQLVRQGALRVLRALVGRAA